MSGSTWLAVLAALCLSLLSIWHQVHPDLPTGNPASVVSTMTHAADSRHSDTDHASAHEALHGMALPAAAFAPILAGLAVSIWHVSVVVLAPPAAHLSLLRPPRI